MTSRPLIIGGLDPCAADASRLFVECAKDESGDLVHLFELGTDVDDWIPVVRARIISVRELLKTKGASVEPHLALLITAFDAVGIERLVRIGSLSQTLKTLMPGGQSISLIVLLPPMTASDTQKKNTFLFFLRLEDILWEIGFLSVVFVNQASGEFLVNPGADTLRLNGLMELLHRQLLDQDLEPIIQTMGARPFGNQSTVAKRKSGYSTTGVYTLVYLKAECLKYLDARFQYEVFERGLMDTESLVKNRESVQLIQDRVNSFVLAWLDEARSFHPAFDPIEGENDIFARLVKEIIDKIKAPVEKLRINIEGALMKEFCDFLVQSPGYLAGGKVFGEILLGKEVLPIRNKKEDISLGVKFFQKQLCHLTLIQAVEEMLKPYVDEFPSARDMLEAVIAKEATIPEDAKFEMQFVYESARLLFFQTKEDNLGLAAATRVTQEILNSYESSQDQLQELVAQNQKELESAQEELRRYEKDLGIWGRIIAKRKEFREKKEIETRKIESLDERLRDLRKSAEDLRSSMLNVMNRVLIPHTIRVMSNQAFREVAEAFVDEFTQYALQVRNAILSGLFPMPEFRTATAATILDPMLLEKLYQIARNKIEYPEHARRMLEYMSPRLGEMEKELLSYADCASLKEHFLAGRESILDRLRDYTEEQFGPLRQLNILDVLELNGKESAQQILKETLDGLSRFLELSPGLLPLVRTEKKMSTIVTVRSDLQINSRLASDYRHLFDAETNFIDSKDLQIIDITSIVFGFPAFVIHRLSECRDLVLQQGEKDKKDLWPVDFLGG